MTVDKLFKNKKLVTYNEKQNYLTGKTLVVIGQTGGHSYGNNGTKIEVQSVYIPNNNSNRCKINNGNYISFTDLKLKGNTLKDLKEDIELKYDEIEERKKGIENLNLKIEFMEENNINEFDEEMFKVFGVLKTLNNKSLNDIKRAQKIVDILNK